MIRPGVDEKRLTPYTILGRISAAKNELIGPSELARRSETFIDEVVVRTLWMDPATFTVTVAGGVVTLVGRVDRRSDIAVLVGLIRGVDGVVSVHCELDFKYDDTTPMAAGPFRAIL